MKGFPLEPRLLLFARAGPVRCVVVPWARLGRHALPVDAGDGPPVSPDEHGHEAIVLAPFLVRPPHHHNLEDEEKERELGAVKLKICYGDV